ncbi:MULTISPECIES: hypothetical protein [Nitrosomonas]|uniref:Uncharacterized protein n=1 Tax=Nitrosomonas communis TaxID=44574 RepID=A0A5D3Y8V1_9PROT|nr:MULTISPECIES: hypothetical protein [Nitrosomonas]TYP78312.1 hypothetical protein BCL69_107718 [Nitrosomonas communis]UVS62576.1 hypothetical protein NX761_05495 [Nitrosomonas sp. PLL12]
MAFQFELDEEVTDDNGKEGLIIGRFEFSGTSPGYLVSFVNDDGFTFDQYKSESALTKK